MSYSYYRSIDIKADSVSANESNFPVALVLTDSDLATTGNGGHVENTDANGGASGSLTVPADFDVCTDPDDVAGTGLDFEIVDYTASSGYIEIWIEVDSVATGSSPGDDTRIFFVYGDSGVTTSQEDVAGTWGNGFVSVYHMQQGGSGTAYDSAGSNDASDNCSATGSTGQIGDGQEFDGSDDYYDCGTSFESTFRGDFTISLWARPSDGVPSSTEYFFGTRDPMAPLTDVVYGRLRIDDGLIGFYYESDDDGAVATTNAAPFSNGQETYHQVSFVADADAGGVGGLKIYFDGDEETLDASRDGDTTGITFADFGDSNYNLRIGDSMKYNESVQSPLDGEIDEFMISSVTRDSDWMATSYANQNDPTPSSTFWSALGAEQSAGCDIDQVGTVSWANIGYIAGIAVADIGQIAGVAAS